MAKYIDLHTHIYFSDGGLSPSQLIEKAKEKELAAIAVTDHDNIDGLNEAISTGEKLGLEVVPGIEITSYPNEKQEFHILGYFIDWESEGLRKTLSEFQNIRETRAHKVIKNLNNFGYLINFGDLRALARGTIVQPHIAWVVINDQENRKRLEEDFGKLPTTGEFIVKYLIPGALAYEPRETVNPRQAIELIKKYSGVAVLAHPCWNAATKSGSDITFNDSLIYDLIKDGIQGIEALAHRDTQEDTKICVEHFEELAEKEGLVVTGGSDYHGFGSAGKELGFENFYLKVPYQHLERLKKARNR